MSAVGVIAVDVDGTLYDGVTVHPDAIAALADARRQGFAILVVSGRPWRDLPLVAPDVVELAIGAVCEDGAVFVDPATGTHHRFAPEPPDGVVDELVRRGARDVVPGEIAIGMPVEHLAIAREIVALHHGRLRLELNKNSVAVVPMGSDKGRGMRLALELLGLGGVPVLAIGDASNDLPMFRAATTAAAVANADAAVVAAGIRLARLPCGEGVAEIVREHVGAAQRATIEATPSSTRTS
jgi:hydroxymethylpyrimidine pyrophosphatase-like HAD family hydrolase